jgi:hypothetical protein
MRLSNGAAVMAGNVILMSPFGSAQGKLRRRISKRDETLRCAQGDDRGRSVCAIMGLAFVFLAVVPFFSIKESAAQGALEKIAISYPWVSSTGGVVPWIAKERGFFTAHGLDAELIYTSGAMSIQGLMGGSVGLLLGSIFDPLSAIAAGADIVVLGSFNNSPPYVMAARSDVREVKDLKGAQGRSEIADRSGHCHDPIYSRGKRLGSETRRTDSTRGRNG